MPVYEYHCSKCNKVTEEVHSIESYPRAAVCESCGGIAKKILSANGAIQYDSINDVPWLASACKVLQRPNERRLQSRTEHKQYLKDNDLVCVG